MKSIKKVMGIIILISLFSTKIIAQTDVINYLDQELVGNTQKLFPLEVSAGYSAIERVTFSNDGKEIYYAEMDIDASYNTYNNTRIKYYKHDGTQWNGPYVLFENYFSPYITSSGDTMFVQHSNPSELSFSVKTTDGWSTPQVFMKSKKLIGDNKFEGNIQLTNKGNYYLTSSIATNGQGGVDVAKIIISENDTIVESLGEPLNNMGNNNYLLMASDESWAITYTLQGGDHQEGRALISYPKDDGTWTNPKSMGFGGWGVTLSPDNKYLFHSSYSGSRFDTYWIRIDSLIDALKLTNFVPYNKYQIADTTINEGEDLNFTLPENMFIDDDGNETITLTATLSNGDELPEMLEFNEETYEFSGTINEAGSYNIKVTATDTEGETVSDIFKIEVEEVTAIDDLNMSNSITFFPNPASQTLQIKGIDMLLNEVNYKLFGLNSKIIKQGELKANKINIHGLNEGLYILQIQTDNGIISEKILIK